MRVNATQCLRDEHQLILKVIDCFEIALRKARESGEISREVFEPFVEFFRGFADKCHHCKEEDRLFPCLERKGLPREDGPIGVMVQEHAVARQRVSMIAQELQAADGGDPVSKQTVLDHGLKFIELMRGHINKEDHCLFGMADEMIRDADLVTLSEAYQSAESEPGYRSTFEHCRAVGDRLVEQYGPGQGEESPPAGEPG
jgi:hemerythrin-like domain-containing protein